MADATETRDLETTVSAHWAALALVMLLPTVATLLYFVVLSGNPLTQVVYFSSKVVQFAFPLAWVLLVQRRRVRPARPDRRSIVAGILLGAAGVAIGLPAYFGYFKHSPWLASAPDLILAKVDDMGLSNPAAYLMFSVFLSVAHSLLEEYYWRWFAFGQLQRVTGVVPAIVVSSAAFMSHHVIVIHQFLQSSWGATLFFSLCVGLGGAVWAWLYRRYGSLYGPWASHLLIDCGIMWIGFDLIPWHA